MFELGHRGTLFGALRAPALRIFLGASLLPVGGYAQSSGPAVDRAGGAGESGAVPLVRAAGFATDRPASEVLRSMIHKVDLVCLYPIGNGDWYCCDNDTGWCGDVHRG